MHGLSTIAHINQVAVKQFIEREKAALNSKEEAPTFTIEDIENAREEALEEEQDNGYDAGSEAGYDSGYEEGFEAGAEYATKDLAGPESLLDRLISGGVETLEPFSAHYDPALKALVFEQGTVTVYLRNDLLNS